jgi:D-3-phosphoglycerate dehydrogenase
MGKIFIAGEIPEAGYEALKGHELDVYKGEKLIDEEELLKRCRDADAVLSLLSTPVNKKIIDAAEKVKIIANFGAGYDNIDYEYAAEKGIPVTNTPYVSTEATAELTIGLLLAVSRRIPEGDQLCRTTGFNGWAPLFFLGREVYGKTLGIIGFGNIGRSVAKKASGFGLNILYYDIKKESEEKERELGAVYSDFDELLKKSDFITINSAYMPSLKHMIDEREFLLMKKTAYLINCARGPIVNEKSLVKALKDKEIEGAALDVYEFEPKISEELKGMKNVVLTPHIGNATIETREQMALCAAKNIMLVLNGENAYSPVNNYKK